MALDVEAQLIGLADTIEVPGVRLHPDTIPLATEAMYELEEKYGPDSPDPRPYHNASHGLDYIRRGIKLLGITHKYMQSRYQARDHDLIFHAGPGHDRILHLGPGSNEIASAGVTIDRIEKTDSGLNNKTFLRRLGNMIIIGTTADVHSNGQIIQSKLLMGPHDPMILNSAYADLQGIAMEGSDTMYGDASGVALERHNNNPTDEQYIDVLVKQPVMMKENTSDKVIIPQLEYYFGQRAPEVYDELHDVFHDRIVETYAAAVSLSDRPKLQYAALQTVRALDPATYKSTVGGKLIGKAISALHRD